MLTTKEVEECDIKLVKIYNSQLIEDTNMVSRIPYLIVLSMNNNSNLIERDDHLSLENGKNIFIGQKI